MKTGLPASVSVSNRLPNVGIAIPDSRFQAPQSAVRKANSLQGDSECRCSILPSRCSTPDQNRWCAFFVPVECFTPPEA